VQAAPQLHVPAEQAGAEQRQADAQGVRAWWIAALAGSDLGGTGFGGEAWAGQDLQAHLPADQGQESEQQQPCHSRRTPAAWSPWSPCR
jgi:hypothetical protein